MQITSYSRQSTSLLAHLLRLRETTSTATRLAICSYEDGASLSSLSLGYDTDLFDSAIELPNGRVLLIPYSSRAWVEYDPVADTLQTVAAETSASRYTGAALALNGRVIAAPRLSTSLAAYDYATKTVEYVSIPAAVTAGKGGCCGAVALKDGRVLLIPRDGPRFFYIDPSSLTVTDGPERPSGVEFNGGSLLPDGRVLLSEWLTGNGRVYVLDPATDTLTAGMGFGTGPVCPGIVVPSGDIVYPPYSARDLCVYNLAAGTIFRRYDAALTGSSRFRGGALAPCGRVVFAPYNYGAVEVYDPVSDTYEMITVGDGSGARSFSGAVALSTGKTMLIPFDYGSIGLVSTVSAGVVPEAFRLSVFAARY